MRGEAPLPPLLSSLAGAILKRAFELHRDGSPSLADVSQGKERGGSPRKRAVSLPRRVSLKSLGRPPLL